MTFGFGSGAESRMIEKLVTVVDARLYIGKENGKNQVVSKSCNLTTKLTFPCDRSKKKERYALFLNVRCAIIATY